jgi:hypothetical protein
MAARDWVVGLCLSERRVTAAALEKSADRVLPRAFVSVEVEGEGADVRRTLLSVLRELRRRGVPSRAALVSCLAADRLWVRELLLPSSSPGRMKQIVRTEMEQLLQEPAAGFVLQNLRPVGQDDRCRVIPLAAPREEVAQLLITFRSARADPLMLGLDALAAVNACQWCERPADGQAYLVFYVDLPSVSIVYCRGCDVVSLRSFRLGEEQGNPRGLALELARWLGPLSVFGTPAAAYLTGSRIEDATSGLLRSACTELGLELKRPGLSLAFGDGSPADTDLEDMAAPVGLALEGLGIRSVGVDFRQEEFRYASFIEGVGAPAVTAMALLACLLSALCLSAWQQLRVSSAGLDALRAEEQALWHALYPGKEPPADVKRELQSEVTQLTGSSGDGQGAVARRSQLDLLQALMRAVPAEAEFWPTEISVTPSGVHVQADTTSYAAAAAIAESVAALPAVEAALHDVRLVSANRCSFVLEVTARD